MKMNRVSRVTLALFAVATVSTSLCESAENQPAIVRTMADTTLQWGPCPEFLPAGCQIAVLNGDPAKANADIFFKVPGKAKLPLHWHTSAERMILVAGELTVQYDGQSAVTLKPGSYAYGPARKAHSGECVSSTPCVIFIAFEAPIDATPGK